MEINHITKVVISKEDIQNAIFNELARQGLKPLQEIKINISKRTVGYGVGEREELYISDTILECKKN